MAMQMRMRERKGGHVSVACFRTYGFMRLRWCGAEVGGQYNARRIGEQETFGGLQFMGKHDDALRMGRASEL